MRTGIQAIDEKIDAAIAEASRRFGAAAVERVAASRFTKFEAWQPNEALQRPTWLFTPGLTARPFWERAQCGRLERIIEALEAAGPKIVEEVRSVDPATGSTYQHISLSAEQIQGWKNWFFYRAYRPNDEILARVPSMRVVEREGIDQGEVQLSVLEPSAHIPPHHGGTNLRLTLHLPLIVPEGDTALRVGDAARGWTENKVLVFDDSYEHEAWNRTGQRRAVIILAAYHPDLSLDEIGAFQMLESVLVESYRMFLKEQGIMP
jgi:aspartate beta-hydroxylase